MNQEQGILTVKIITKQLRTLMNKHYILSNNLTIQHQIST